MSSGGNTVASGGSIAKGSEVSLTATVTSGSTKVTVGQVNFCDGSVTYCTDIHLLGTAQLTSAGTATIKFHPGLGDHSYKAVFAGTPNGSIPYAGSTSNTVTFTVTGISPTTTTITSSGSAGNYTLTAEVTGTASVPWPSGTISFLDTSNGNLSLGTATLKAISSTVSFANYNSLSQGYEPSALVVTDFNGDGIPDLAVLSVNSLTILLGNGDGTFNRTNTVIDIDAQSIAVGDFNGDGIPDLAVTIPQANSNNVAIFLGNGDGTFTGVNQILVVINTPGPVAVGDFNRDGFADLAVVGGDSITVFLGNGDGTFTTAAGTPAVGMSPSSIVVGDFNGDGISDLAVTNACGNSYPCSDVGTMTILLGNGDGTFTATSETPSAGDSPVFVAVGDFNRDGNLDLAALDSTASLGATNGAVTILLGNGDGTFKTVAVSPATDIEPVSIAVGDYNGDGIPDIAVGSNNDEYLKILLGNGDGTFVETAADSGANLTSGCVVAADFNGDGLDDIATTYESGSTPTAMVSALLSQAVGSATATATGISPIGVGTHQVDASFPGDTIYNGSLSTTIGLIATGFAITGTTVSVAPGATASNMSTITVTPSGNFTGSVTLTAKITSSPNDPQYLPTLSFGSTSLVNITGTSSGTATLTISTTAATSAAITHPKLPGVPWYVPGSATLACALLFGVPKRRRRWQTAIGMLTLFVALAGGMLACGSGGGGTGGGGGGGVSGTTAGAYTITVTGTSASTTAIETGTLTLNVQ